MKLGVVRRALSLIFALGLLTGAAIAGPDTEAHAPSQNIADALREAAGAEAAFIPAGMLRESTSRALAEFLQYPTDQIAVVQLTGAQIRQALERSVSLYPSPNSSFLQLAGMEVAFSRSAQPERRITSVSVGGGALSDSRTYSVAMPRTLARGGLGYFKVWEREAITTTLEITLADAVGGRQAEPSPARWTAEP